MHGKIGPLTTPLHTQTKAFFLTLRFCYSEARQARQARQACQRAGMYLGPQQSMTHSSFFPFSPSLPKYHISVYTCLLTTSLHHPFSRVVCVRTVHAWRPLVKEGTPRGHARAAKGGEGVNFGAQHGTAPTPFDKLDGLCSWKQSVWGMGLVKKTKCTNPP